MDFQKIHMCSQPYKGKILFSAHWDNIITGCRIDAQHLSSITSYGGAEKEAIKVFNEFRTYANNQQAKLCA